MLSSTYNVTLAEEINTMVDELSIQPNSCPKRNRVIEKINSMLTQVTEYRNLTVSTFGSAASGLATQKSDIDLCITSPDLIGVSNSTKSALEIRPNSIFNMDYLASKLRSIGMTNINAIKNARVPICTFTDPDYGITCDININSLLGIENTKLIVQYIQLDSRVKPFLFALKLFVKSKEIQNCKMGFVSTYSFLMIGLHYLMFVQQPPVIPCLQRLSNAVCSSNKCRYNLNSKKVLGYNVRYHDCVCIENLTNKDFSTSRDNSSTIWYGYNGKDVGQLVFEMFEWSSSTQNVLKSKSLTTNGHIRRESGWNKHDTIFPDPFIPDRNIVGTCTSIGARVISQEFGRAYRKLKTGYNFSSVLNIHDRVPRPVDPKSMHYRFPYRR